MTPRPILLLAVVLSSIGCAVGPRYKRPSTPQAPEYKEAPASAIAAGQWKTAEPQDEASRGKWWTVYGDPQLDALEEQVTVSNQTIARAEAQYRAVRASVRLARGDLFPSLSVGASATRASGLTNRQAAQPGGAAPTVTSYQLPLDASWEPDVFGRVRRSVPAVERT